MHRINDGAAKKLKQEISKLSLRGQIILHIYVPSINTFSGLDVEETNKKKCCEKKWTALGSNQ
jgi:hypothetical protein